MANCLGNIPTRELKSRSLAGIARIVFGLLLTWWLISGASVIKEIRIRDEEMTSFTPLGLISTMILSPLWIALHFLTLKYYRRKGQTLVATIVPTMVVATVSLWAIWHFNDKMLSELAY